MDTCGNQTNLLFIAEANTDIHGENFKVPELNELQKRISISKVGAPIDEKS